MTERAVVGLGWLGIVRLGLVQSALGAIVVLTTSTLNRLMVIELALPAMIPGALVALHYAVQILRPRMGYGSDVGGRRTPWIVGGMMVLALGAVLAAAATSVMSVSFVPGLVLAVIAFLVIGLGVSAAGTNLLVLLAKQTAKDRRAAAATIVWLMMIAGFAVTAIVVGRLLEPFSFGRLIVVTSGVGVAAVLVAIAALAGIEPRALATTTGDAEAKPAMPEFRAALAEVWVDSQARRLTIFIFVSMLAYSTQDLILEPFAGLLFGYTPGQSTMLSGVHHGGVFAGMVLVAVCATAIGGRWLGSLRLWTIGGCLASAAALIAVIAAGFAGPAGPLKAAVVVLGIANGAFAIAAIGTMMRMAGEGRAGREGTRMGLWGAAQGIAFGLGGFGGTVMIDVARGLVSSPSHAYALVFGIEAALFVTSAVLAFGLTEYGARGRPRDWIWTSGTRAGPTVADVPRAGAAS
ncbi:MAG TPA: BCD family MFS transporter [Hyphomicrobiaceae bacterium]|nr:BCD family MFS transporter [Hyphomicrobiaceae bacterium]